MTESEREENLFSNRLALRKLLMATYIFLRETDWTAGREVVLFLPESWNRHPKAELGQR